VSPTGREACEFAHDLNNLLGLIMSYADLVHEALDSPAPAEVEAVFEQARADTEAILEAAEAAATLTHQLLLLGGAGYGSNR
jgi:hypothetical protein